MRSEASPTRTGTGQDLRNHEVDRNSIRTDPRPGMLPEREPPGPQQFRQERRVAQIWRRNAEIGVGRVLGSSEVGIAGVEIDCLRTDEHHGVELFGERFGSIEQRAAGANV